MAGKHIPFDYSLWLFAFSFWCQPAVRELCLNWSDQVMKGEGAEQSIAHRIITGPKQNPAWDKFVLPISVIGNTWLARNT